MLNFGTGKKNLAKMEKALGETQSHIKLEEDRNSLNHYQFALVIKTKTFLAFAEAFGKDGLSEWGGLTNYCINALTILTNLVNENAQPLPIHILVGEKMVFVVNAIEHVAPTDVLNELDMALLNQAKILSENWLDSPKRTDLLNQLDPIIGSMDGYIKDKGYIMSMQSGSDFFKPLTQW